MADAPEIVVGIDYGTTHSGASWAFSQGNRNVTVIKNWSSRKGSPTADKISSCIAYRNGRLDAWGGMVKRYDPGTVQVKWIKLLLDPQYSVKTIIAAESAQLLKTMRKSPERAVADYLEAFWAFVRDQIAKSIGEDFEDIYTIRIVLTCPAIWSPRAKDTTKNAARLAKMPDTIQLVSEPEAATLAVLHEHNDRDLLTTGDVIIICDAGGGTVDLISYLVENTHPLRLTECAIGDGDACGSTVLDDRFKTAIKYIVGSEAWDRTNDKSRSIMMQEFEDSVKRTFDGTNEDLSVELKGAGDDEARGIQDDTITLPMMTLKTIFEPVFGSIITLIDKQIEMIVATKLKPKMVMLVGGFGESDYLFTRLEAEYRNQQIQVLKSTGAWSAITRGATLWGLENPLHQSDDIAEMTVNSRMSRDSYGYEIAPVFDARRHKLSDRYIDEVDGSPRARNQMCWLTKKGDTIRHGVPIDSKHYRHSKESDLDTDISWSQVMYYCKADTPPTMIDSSVHVLCELEYSISRSVVLELDKQVTSVQNGLPYRRVGTTSLMTCGVELEFAMKYRDRIVGSVKARYPPDPQLPRSSSM